MPDRDRRSHGRRQWRGGGGRAASSVRSGTSRTAPWQSLPSRSSRIGYVVRWYQQLSKKQALVCQWTNTIIRARDITARESLDILPRQILGLSCLDPPLLVSFICDSGGLPQQSPIKIILFELQYWFMCNYAFLRSRRQARGTLVLHQYPTSSSNSFTGTPTKAITKLICVHCLCSIWRTQAAGHSKW